jgi:hypothetical protein
MLVFDILQIPSECIQICSGCIAPTCTPLATDLLVLMTSLRRVTGLRGKMKVKTALRLDIHFR